MKTHHLKTWPEYFEATFVRDKLFEIRKNDRDYHVGDRLVLCEYDQARDEYTGRELLIYVDYVLDLHDVTPLEGYVALGFENDDGYSECAQFSEQYPQSEVTP